MDIQYVWTHLNTGSVADHHQLMVSPGNKAKKWFGDSYFKEGWVAGNTSGDKTQNLAVYNVYICSSPQLEHSHPDTVLLKRTPNSNFKALMNSFPFFTSHLLFRLNMDCWYWGFNLICCIETAVSTVRPLIPFSETNCSKGFSFGLAFYTPLHCIRWTVSSCALWMILCFKIQ